MRDDDDAWLEGSDDDDRVSVKLATKAELAAVTGLTLLQIDRLCRDGAPVARRGTSRKAGLRFSLPEFIQWFVERTASRRAAAGPGAKVESAKERAAAAQARLRELEIAKKEGELVETGIMCAYLEKMCGTFRSGVLNLPSQIPNLTEAQRRDFDDATHALLTELSRGYDEATGGRKPTAEEMAALESMEAGAA